MEQKVKIREVIRETGDAITIKFQNNPLFENYHSGQFLNLYDQLNGEIVGRSYSFSSAPGTDDYPAVTVKQVNGGRLSGHLVKNLRAGQEISASEPAGRFALNQNDLDSKHLIMIAGGSGITPLYSMIKSAISNSAAVHITLLYGNKNMSSIIFKKELESLQLQFSTRFKVYHFLEEKTENISNATLGFISKNVIEKAIQNYTEAPTEIYLCGPSLMMNSVEEHLEQLGFDTKKLFKESYGTSVNTSTGTEGKQSKYIAEISIKQGNDIISLEVENDSFILQTALDKGIKLPHSCKEAMCGSCKIKLLSGKVELSENYALTDSQLQEGYVLLCSGKPASPKIELSYT